jgi:hypothetical protein
VSLALTLLLSFFRSCWLSFVRSFCLLFLLSSFSFLALLARVPCGHGSSDGDASLALDLVCATLQLDEPARESVTRSLSSSAATTTTTAAAGVSRPTASSSSSSSSSSSHAFPHPDAYPMTQAPSQYMAGAAAAAARHRGSSQALSQSQPSMVDYPGMMDLPSQASVEYGGFPVPTFIPTARTTTTLSSHSHPPSHRPTKGRVTVADDGAQDDDESDVAGTPD